jgi:CRP-like cAMP-binding protein
MLTVEKVALLVSSDMFSLVPTTALASLAGVMRERNYGAGEMVIREGEPGASLFVVADGAVEVDAGGRSVTLGPGKVIGELALLAAGPRSATVTASEDALLLELSRDDFDLAMADHPELSEGVIRYLVRLVRATTAASQSGS